MSAAAPAFVRPDGTMTPPADLWAVVCADGAIHCDPEGLGMECHGSEYDPVQQVAHDLDTTDLGREIAPMAAPCGPHRAVRYVAVATRVAAVVAAARRLLCHDEADDSREGLENCHEASVLRDALEALDAGDSSPHAAPEPAP